MTRISRAHSEPREYTPVDITWNSNCAHLLTLSKEGGDSCLRERRDVISVPFGSASRRARKNRYVAVVIVVATIIGAVVKFTTAFDSFLNLIGLDRRHARVIYRPLADDLANLERAMIALGESKSHWSFVQAEVQMVEVAAEPVCNARKSVAELGDASTRRDLDVICKAVEIIKKFSNPQTNESPVGAVALARTIAPLVKKNEGGNL